MVRRYKFIPTVSWVIIDNSIFTEEISISSLTYAI